MVCSETKEQEYIVSARSSAEMGMVSRIIKVIREADLSQNAKDEIVETLLHSVEVAVDRGRLTDAIEVLGTPGIPIDIQTLSVEIIAQKGKAQWLSGVYCFRDVPEDVGAYIVEVLAEAGRVTEVLRMARNETVTRADRDLPGKVVKRAREVLADALENDKDDMVKELTKKELIDMSRILAKNLLGKDPLAEGGIISSGTVKKPALPSLNKARNKNAVKMQGNKNGRG